MVSAIGNEGKYDLYMMNSDGSENNNITHDYFSADDSKVFFCWRMVLRLVAFCSIFVGSVLRFRVYPLIANQRNIWWGDKDA